MRLEDERHAIRKAVLTGCLRVSKASLFTDLNNFDVNSVCTQGDPLSSVIGFTPTEVSTLLSYYWVSDGRFPTGRVNFPREDSE